MTFNAYIERQKSMIKNRHEGETFMNENGDSAHVNESEKLLTELCSLKGLNTEERLSYRRAGSVV